MRTLKEIMLGCFFAFMILSFIVAVPFIGILVAAIVTAVLLVQLMSGYRRETRKERIRRMAKAYNKQQAKTEKENSSEDH